MPSIGTLWRWLFSQNLEWPTAFTVSLNVIDFHDVYSSTRFQTLLEDASQHSK